MQATPPVPPSDPHPSSSSHHPLVWALAGAFVVMLLVCVALAAVWIWAVRHPALAKTPSAPAANTPPAAAPLQPVPKASVSIRDAAAKVTDTPEDVIARVKHSVVLILTERDDGVASGTGFPVDDRHVATCAHVVANANQVTLVTSDGSRLRASVAEQDPVTDVAVLETNGELPPPLRLGTSAAIREGSEVAITGYPVVGKLLELGYVPVASTSRGTISALRQRETEQGVVEQLQTDASINPGNSGGPVYSVQSGAVLGLAAARMVEESGIGFATPVKALRALLGRDFQPESHLMPARAHDPTVLLAVSGGGGLDPVCRLEQGAYVEPAHSSLDSSTSGSAASFLRPGQEFEVVFGGAAAGTARVLRRVETGRAVGEVSTAAPLRGRVLGLAVNRPDLLHGSCTRRLPTPLERSFARTIATRAFASNGVPQEALSGLTVTNLTAGDLDGDGRCELMGSFTVPVNGGEQHLFLLLTPRSESGYRTALRAITTAGDQENGDQALVDWLDLDGDGCAELVTISRHAGSWRYTIYSRKQGVWLRVYNGGGHDE